MEESDQVLLKIYIDTIGPSLASTSVTLFTSIHISARVLPLTGAPTLQSLAWGSYSRTSVCTVGLVSKKAFTGSSATL
jgi:hypothetical protein